MILENPSSQFNIINYQISELETSVGYNSLYFHTRDTEISFSNKNWQVLWIKWKKSINK